MLWNSQNRSPTPTALKFASTDATMSALKEKTMRTTLALDDDLLTQAQALTGLSEKTSLVREALRALIQRESAKRLALLGGSEPNLNPVPRRQSEPHDPR
jgi:Arc/MetJ family transcription regulator